MSYEDPVNQGSMALDAHRNAYYERALKKVLRPDSVVLDAGAGIGTLGLMAARLGARHVYLVEPTTQMETIQQLISANNLTERVTLLPTTVETANLPEPVDIITSVFTGNFLLEEDLLPSLIIARDRWLAQDGYLLPGMGRMMVMPVSIAQYYDSQIGIWSKDMAGVQHDVMHAFAVNTLYHDRFNQVKYEPLAAATELSSLDFYTAVRAECDAEIEFTLTAEGACHGFLCWFDMSFEDDWLSTSPQEKATHWSQVFMPLDPVLNVAKGDKLQLHVKRLEFADWHWQVRFGDEFQKHSTFLSRPISPADIARRSLDYSPALNAKGLLLQALLGLMDGNRTNDQIAERLFEKFPNQFGHLAAAKRYVCEKASDLGFEKWDE